LLDSHKRGRTPDKLLLSFMGFLLFSGIKDEKNNIGNRITEIPLEIGSSIEKKVSGIPLKVFRIKHLGDASGDKRNLAYLVNLNGVKILHIGDGTIKYNFDYFEKFRLEKENIDILFLRFFETDEDTLRFVKDIIKPKYIIAMHIPTHRVAEESQNFSKVYANGIVFKEAMENKTFEFD